MITSRRQSELDKAVAEIGKNVTTVLGDVSKLEDLDRLYSAVSSEGRRITQYIPRTKRQGRRKKDQSSISACHAQTVNQVGRGNRNICQHKPNPTSFDLRRDTGIWAGVLAITHTVIGLNVHLRGRIWMYFFKRLHPLALQNTQFGFGNFTGLVAALLFLMLLAVSKDLSIRRLGLGRWKSLQRWTYIAFGLTVAHGLAYQLIEKRPWPWVILSAFVVLAVILVQMRGLFRSKTWHV